jgi:hypothetical protein
MYWDTRTETWAIWSDVSRGVAIFRLSPTAQGIGWGLARTYACRTGLKARLRIASRCEGALMGTLNSRSQREQTPTAGLVLSHLATLGCIGTYEERAKRALVDFLHFIAPYFFNISVVLSIGSASTLCPRPVVVVARNMEL